MVTVDLTDLMFDIEALRKTSAAPTAEGTNW